MIRVLITGAGSYIGTHIAAHLSRYPDRFHVEELDVQQGLQPQAFSGFDTVIHVAGIAHRAETPQSELEYMAVNGMLPVEAARQAKYAGVKHFIFFSSMSVYGQTTGRITADTPLEPNTFYGRSKMAAEDGLRHVADDSFRIAVLRPPMIYGRGCRGNYPRLAALARKLPAFPKVNNERSMLYIGTLCAFVDNLVQSGKGGLFFPQNREYVSTVSLVTAVARCHKKKLFLVRGFRWLIRLLENRVGVVGKVFGTLTYDKAMSGEFAQAGQLDFPETIRRTEAE